MDTQYKLPPRRYIASSTESMHPVDSLVRGDRRRQKMWDHNDLMRGPDGWHGTGIPYMASSEEMGPCNVVDQTTIYVDHGSVECGGSVENEVRSAPIVDYYHSENKTGDHSARKRGVVGGKFGPSALAKGGGSCDKADGALPVLSYREQFGLQDRVVLNNEQGEDLDIYGNLCFVSYVPQYEDGHMFYVEYRIPLHKPAGNEGSIRLAPDYPSPGLALPPEKSAYAQIVPINPFIPNIAMSPSDPPMEVSDHTVLTLYSPEELTRTEAYTCTTAISPRCNQPSMEQHSISLKQMKQNNLKFIIDNTELALLDHNDRAAMNDRVEPSERDNVNRKLNGISTDMKLKVSCMPGDVTDRRLNDMVDRAAKGGGDVHERRDYIERSARLDVADHRCCDHKSTICMGRGPMQMVDSRGIDMINMRGEDTMNMRGEDMRGGKGNSVHRRGIELERRKGTRKAGESMTDRKSRPGQMTGYSKGSTQHHEPSPNPMNGDCKDARRWPGGYRDWGYLRETNKLNRDTARGRYGYTG